MMSDRERVAEVLGLQDWEIFTCKKCSRRFFLKAVENEREIMTDWRRQVLNRKKFDPDGHHVCGECHSSNVFYPGETFLP